jgi:hypothetical protein
MVVNIVNEIIEKVGVLGKENEELKRRKVQAEALLAAIIKQTGPIEMNFDEVYKSDIQKVKLKPDEEDPSKITIFYETDETE